MVNACLLYGVELTLEDFKSIIPPKDDAIKEWLESYYDEDDDEHGDEEPEVDEDNDDKDDKYDDDEIKSYQKVCGIYEACADEDYHFACELVNEHFSLTPLCEFRLNSACCCTNKNNKPIFVGWTSKGAWSNGLFSKKIKILSKTEESMIDNTILTYFPEETPRYYIAAKDCDYCT